MTIFWEKQDIGEFNTPKMLDPIKKVINTVKKAKTSVILYSPYITSSELQIVLEDKAKEGIRYILLQRA